MIKIKNFCPFPNRAAHEPVAAETRFNRKVIHVTLHDDEMTVEGDVRVCKNCGALYVEAVG